MSSHALASVRALFGIVGPALLIGWLIGCLIGCLSGCGSMAAQDPQAPHPDATTTTSRTVGEANAAFDAAEDELASLIVSGDDVAQPGYGVSGPDAPPAKPAEMSTSRSERRRHRCSRACRALASMQRAADHLCEMTGEDDSRCRNVRERVRAARRLVLRACPSCQA